MSIKAYAPALLAIASRAFGEGPDLEFAKTVEAGRKCDARNVLGEIQTDCTFKVGKDLEIAIAGVNDDMASVSVVRSNRDGDYFVKYQVAVGCLLVTSGFKSKKNSQAFIHPKTAKVFSTWMECGRAEK